MANNVGKIIFFELFGILSIALNIHAYVDLSINAIDGGSLHQAGVGRPFIVTVAAAGNVDSEPKIQGMEQFQVVSKSKQMSKVNNRITVSYSYQVYANAPGNYTIGPATVDVSGTSKQSNSRTVHVAEQEKIDEPTKQETAKLQLTVDKSHVVVGEKIQCKLQFCGNSDLTQLQQIQKPRFDAIVDTQGEPVVRSEQRNGTAWTIAEWTFELHSNKPGRLVIPASSADIAIHREANDQLSAFTLFFKYRNEHHKIYSNAVTIEVDELPVSQDTVQSVGTFTRFQATLKPAVAKEGEGMVLTLELEGDAQLNSLEVPQLQNMPRALKWYESKHYLHEPQGNKINRTACFEYVVQGLQQGKWEIPAQRLTYFDVKDRSVKTIKSSPITVLIEPNDFNRGINKPFSPPEKQEGTEREDELSPIITTGSWQSPVSGMIPWSLFIILVIIPLLWALWQGIQLYAVHSAPYFMYRYAFFFARKQLKKAERENDGEQLLGIFSQAIALRLKIPISLISQEIIAKKLREAKMPEEKTRSFESFLSVLHELSFCKGQTVKSSPALFEQSRSWLNELEAVL